MGMLVTLEWLTKALKLRLIVNREMLENDYLTDSSIIFET